MKFVVKERENDDVVWEYMVADEPVNHNHICKEIGVGNICSRERGQFGVPIGDILEIDDPEQALDKLDNFLDENSAREKLDEFEKFLREKIYEGKIEPGEESGELSPEDFERISEWKRKNEPDIRLYQLIQAYINYLKANKENKNKFKFEAEF